MSIAKHLLSLAFAFGVAASAQAGVTYTSVPNGGAFASLGTWETASVGEVFTVPTDGNSRLDLFSFYLRGDLSAAYAGITTWNGSPAGELGSDDIFRSDNVAAYFDDYTEVSIDTGGLDLTPGQQYLAYLSVWFLEDAGADEVALGDGSAVHAGSTYVHGYPLGTGWNTPLSSDLAGRFVFSGAADDTNVPEPGSVALLGLGIAGLACMRRRVK